MLFSTLYFIDDSTSFGHYAVPFELCHVWLMIQFHLDTMPCHLNYAIYDWWFNFIWTLCRAIWSMPFMIDDSIFIWTLCRAIWSMPFMIDDSISFGHYAVPFELCHLWFNFIWTLCRAIWPMTFMIDDPPPFGHYAVPFGLCHLWLMIQFHLDTMLCHLNYAIMIDDSISLGHYAVPFELC